MAFERGRQTLAVYLTRDGQLAGIQLAPAADAEPAAPWEPPGYADPDRFDEAEVTLGTGPLAVPGTLSLPRAAGPLPALVLLGGSGPEDRDGSIGRSKPLKDLAWGLASRGVAVLRFDKVTHAHPDLVSENRAFTVADEYLPDALAAIGLLQAHPAVDAARVFVAGHSLGGTIAPRVAAAEPSVAGLVMLAGGAEPLQWAAVRQISYLASLAPATAAPSQPGIDALTAQARKVDSPDLSTETPDAELPFGVPAPYWLDLRRYDPVGVAAGPPPADAAGPGRPGLPGDGGRRPQPVAGGPGRAAGCHDPRVPGRQPLLLPRRRPVQPGRARARAAPRPRGRRRHRRLADGRALARLTRGSAWVRARVSAVCAACQRRLALSGS